MESVNCKYCGKKIFFALTDKGQRHPFDARQGLAAELDKAGFVDVRCAHLSHFATCKKYREGSK